MCGIAGALQKPATGNVKSMIKKLAHRGPDGFAVVELGDATLGHTRLAILDIEGGRQPMHLENTWIVFNGEIYNYRELQRQHLSDERMKTHSDTEVLLHLYRKFGPGFVNMLDGMFAFVIYQDGEYLLVRDPLGIKPLYYGPDSSDQRLYFASEIKAMVGHAASIQEFPAGHWFHSRLGWKRYYDLRQTIQPFELTEAEALPQIKSSLRAAVHKRLLADVPVGISLSGGLDSSIISLLACEGTDQLHSFAVGMQGSEDLAAARKMYEFLHTQHHELVYTGGDMLEALPDVLYHLETFDPALVRSAIPNFFLAKLASQYVKVFLTGEGADEVYAGYEYLAQYDSPSVLQAEMINITEALHNTNLQRTDRMSMAFSLEARVPFLDVQAVALALSFPAAWKIHNGHDSKTLLRNAFTADLPQEIVNRPKQKFSKGAGSSDLLAHIAEGEISDREFASESRRLKSEWDYTLQNKEALYYYKILRQSYEDGWVFSGIGKSRSL
jgi:asparagine synthase (glutamine-hydrolysing)